MDSSAAWSDIATSTYVSLGTFRKSGEVVRTPVWIAPEGDELVVTTDGASGKVKRLRRNAKVTLQACDRTGNIEPGSALVFAHGRVVPDDARANAALKAKYGLQFTAIATAERLMKGVRRRASQRVIVRIAAALGSAGSLPQR